MKFEEIFNEDGLYVADGFADGTCLRVLGGLLLFVTYANSEDVNPVVVDAIMHKNLLTKDYKKVHSREKLFNKEI